MPPDWYQQLPRPKEGIRGRNQSDAETQLGRLKTYVIKAKSKVQNRASVLGADFDEILERLHTLAFLRVDGPLLKMLRMLERAWLTSAVRRRVRWRRPLALVPESRC